MMSANGLKVDARSHCTTPSERNVPQLVSVKVGCFSINPASMRGRRIFLLQMVVLCFVPHAALILQNCSIMAQLSQTFDSSLFLNDEINMTLSLGEMVLAIQDERAYVTRYLFSDSLTSDVRNTTTMRRIFFITDFWLDDAPPLLLSDELKMTLYHYREDVLGVTNMKRTESIKRISVYKKLNSILLVHMIKAVKATKTPLWRQLSACYEFIKTLEDLSILQTLVTYSLVSADQEQLLEPVKQQLELAVEHLESALQYLEFEKFNDDEILKEMLMYYKTTLTNVSEADFKMDDWDSVGNDYVEKTSGFVEVSKTMQTGLWKYVRKSADHEVWYARRTLALGVFVLVIVLLASPVLILILRHIITTIQMYGKHEPSESF